MTKFPCAYCGKPREEVSNVFCKNCWDKRQTHLSDERYLAALKRLKAVVAQGVELNAEDSTTPGDKYTTTTWGLCSEDPAHWPDKFDHLWPHSFETEGRVAPLHLAQHQLCPFDKRDKGGVNGCFYSCRIFQGPKPTREQALELYDMRISQAEERQNAG